MSGSQKKYMLDTNIFNHVMDGIISYEKIKNYEMYATHIQKDELEKTPNIDRRSDLIDVFVFLKTELTPTSEAVWGVSKWDQAKWSGDDNLYESLVERINELDKLSGKKSSNINVTGDALIAATAIREGFVLVTKDSNLSKVARENGCSVIDGLD